MRDPIHLHSCPARREARAKADREAAQRKAKRAEVARKRAEFEAEHGPGRKVRMKPPRRADTYRAARRNLDRREGTDWQDEFDKRQRVIGQITTRSHSKYSPADIKRLGVERGCGRPPAVLAARKPNREAA